MNVEYNWQLAQVMSVSFGQRDVQKPLKKLPDNTIRKYLHVALGFCRWSASLSVRFITETDWKEVYLVFCSDLHFSEKKLSFSVLCVLPWSVGFPSCILVTVITELSRLPLAPLHALRNGKYVLNCVQFNMKHPILLRNFPRQSYKDNYLSKVICTLLGPTSAIYS
jgi:hypothetical protein